jgi:hypothetical protein
VFTAIATDGRNKLKIGSLGSLEATEILAGPGLLSQAAVQSGTLLFSRDGALIAQPFDETHFRVAGEPVLIVSRVSGDDYSRMAFSMSETGLLVYQPSVPVLSQLMWFSRAGVPTEIGEPGYYADPALAPDGRRAISRARIQPPRSTAYGPWISSGAPCRRS